MKRFIIGTGILFFSMVSCFSQSLVTSNKLWSNLKRDYWHPYNFSTEFFKFTTDTTVNGQVYKKVERSTDANQQYWTWYGLIREDTSKRVFFRYNAAQPEYLFYDFNATVNDTINAFTIHTLTYNQPSIFHVVYYVDSIDSVLIGDRYRKQINLKDTMDPFSVCEHWIDSTGNLGGLLHNMDMSVGRDDYDLLCFYEDGIVKYHHPDFTSCYVLLGIDKEHEPGYTVNISPNPMTDFATVTVGQPGVTSELQIDFFNLFGKPVLSKKIINTAQITRHEFTSGLYFYRIRGDDGSIKPGKLIVK